MQEDLLKRYAPLNLKMESTLLFKQLKHAYCQLIMWIQSLKMKVMVQILKLKQTSVEMIGAMEKGIEAAQITTPPVGVYGGVDLKILPKYICFKAALVREKMLLQYLVLILGILFSLYFFISRYEVGKLYTQLREKEYILAPGVVDFTPASPQSVSDKYVDDAAMSFLSLLGNINAVNVEDNYLRLSKFMSPELKIRFETEIAEWKDTIKEENIAEILKVTDKEVVSDEGGYYRVTAIATRERFINNEYAGNSDEVIEMVLQLVPPQKGKEWYLQINSLARNESQAFHNRQPTKSPPKVERSADE